MYEHILSLKNYFLNGDPDSIRAAAKQQPDLFLSLQPYAAVMGVSEKWAEYFTEENIEVPHWFVNPTGNKINPAELNSALLGLLKKIE
jgi:hypothetical protein